MVIKAIETRYKGYRFRSRLEARWAVFLDALNEEWQYEPEGYDLPSGRYLPDFWLPRMDLWLEIKGIEPNERELKLCEELAKGHGSPVAIATGLPFSAKEFFFDGNDGLWGTWDYFDSIGMAPNEIAQLECRYNAERLKVYCFVGNGWDLYGAYWIYNTFLAKTRDDRLCICSNRTDPSEEYYIFRKDEHFDMRLILDIGGAVSQSSCDVAKSARFEHSERY